MQIEVTNFRKSHPTDLEPAASPDAVGLCGASCTAGCTGACWYLWVATATATGGGTTGGTAAYAFGSDETEE